MTQKITTFLMFEGKAEEAMTFYVSLFKDARVVNALRYGVENPAMNGALMRATFRLNGQEFMCFNSDVKHGFTFTPATSLFVTCETEAEIDTLFQKLSGGGVVLMELAAYPFAKKFAWLNDKFGVSWQLSLA
jgi:predicted 3-demethylubiquinone-9 3-methyltransferase (glyoxalase superfamily)